MATLSRPYIIALLVSLAEQKGAHSELATKVADKSRGSVQLGSGTMVRALQRLRAEGCVKEIGSAPAP